MCVIERALGNVRVSVLNEIPVSSIPASFLEKLEHIC